ncbi:hypothetical protein LTR01_008816 [Friedmanniomyces endolithicus]|nr:hypothetical protein LTS09_017568 [Friedmanniomyces endolithicus]KAK0302347.1 hypothetical protein LTR01_008816 [Friedmanniomyces endolithicus]KAK0823220.1 hypothetical protein LTR73_008691 [Friedmanniomyces endolithicus]
MVWKRALAFICRSARIPNRLGLSHHLNSEQAARLDSALTLAGQHIAVPEGTTDLLDHKCLELCISLLDHRLTGNIFDSALVGALAVLGINEEDHTFASAMNYTPKLSAFIKIAQLLVLHKAIVEVEEGSAPDSLEAHDTMRLRFMTLNNPTPFAWALQLRGPGKQIRDSTTSIGYVRWSDDADILTYSRIRISTDGFREWVSQQVCKAQELFEQPLFLGPDDDRRDVVPPLSTSQLSDNPTVTSPGWNFLQDPRNKKALQGGGTHLLERVLGDVWLREIFCTFEADGTLTWNVARLNSYKRTAHEFLEILLLLVHISGGQPARGTEIVNLAYVNTGCRRKVFIEAAW